MLKKKCSFFNQNVAIFLYFFKTVTVYISRQRAVALEKKNQYLRAALPLSPQPLLAGCKPDKTCENFPPRLSRCCVPGDLYTTLKSTSKIPDE